MCCKNLTDAIARAAADALQGPIQSAYREAFQSVVLPAFEKSCQSMFQQINDTFKQGTQECESCLHLPPPTLLVQVTVLETVMSAHVACFPLQRALQSNSDPHSSLRKGSVISLLQMGKLRKGWDELREDMKSLD